MNVKSKGGPRWPLAIGALLLSVVQTGFAGCGGGPSGSSHLDRGESGTTHRHELAGAEAGALPGESVYHLESRWWTSQGDAGPLAILRGKMQVVAMVYLSCTFSCPRIVGEMKRIEAAIPEALSDRVGLVLVSIDPERDTPERAKAFADGSGLDPDRWTLLTGSEGGVRELAALLGVQIRRVDESDFAHSNVLTLLSEDGEVLQREAELSGAAAAILHRLEGIAASGR